MDSNDSRLSDRSKNLFWSLKVALSHYNVNMKTLVYKLFDDPKKTLFKRAEFIKIVRFGDLKVTFDEIDSVFEQLKEGDGVQLATIQRQLSMLQNPQSAVTSLQKEASEQSAILLGLKEVKAYMLKEDPHYTFDLYDANKDGSLDVAELNALIIGCTQSKQLDVELRKQILRLLLRNQPQNKIGKMKFLELFGMQNVPKRISFPKPPPMMEVQDDKNLANKYALQSRIARKQDILNFQNNINNQPKGQTQKLYLPQEPIRVQDVLPRQIESKWIQQPKEQPKPEPPKPSPKSNSQAMRYYRLDKKYKEMIDLLDFYLINKQTFIDSESPDTSKGKYMHAKDIFKERFHLFNIASSVFSRQKNRQGIAQFIEPKDIIQGSLGDCYFLSSICSLVQYYPEMLSELFLFDINPVGMYVVRLFNDGEWSSIVLDDRFPCVNGKPIFAKPHGNQIWVLLLEKAWAKLHGSYQSIDLGSSMEALIALTGAPCKFYRKQDDDIKRIIDAGFKNGSVVTCSGSDYLNDLPTEVAQKLGLIAKHAYSVQRLVEVSYNGRQQLLVKLRNPWGNEQWAGQWSFNSNRWTDSLRRQFNYLKNPQDGSFYMPWEQFEKYFGSVTVCKIIPNSVCSSYRSNNHRHHSSYIKMRITKKGTYTISAYQESKRKYQNSLNYELSESRMIITKIDEKGNFSYIKSGTKQSSNLHIETELTQGTYMLACKIVWINFEQHECVITSYGPANVQFAPHNDRLVAPKFKKQVMDTFCKAQPGEKYFYEKLNIPQAYREIFFSIDMGLGYIKVSNPSRKAFSTTIVLNKSKGLKVIKPSTEPIQLQMLPSTEVITGFFVSGKGYSYSLQEKMKALM